MLQKKRIEVSDHFRKGRCWHRTRKHRRSARRDQSGAAGDVTVW
jgi:hypothetical protein